MITIGDQSCLRCYAPPKIDSTALRSRARAALAGRGCWALRHILKKGADVLPVVRGAAHEHGHHSRAGLHEGFHQKNLRSIHPKSGTTTQWKMTTASRQAENITNHKRKTCMGAIDVSGALALIAIAFVVVLAIGITRLVMRSNEKKRKKAERWR